MRFEVAKGYEDKNINLPKRATKYSAGYDFEVAETITVPSILSTLLTKTTEGFKIEKISNQIVEIINGIKKKKKIGEIMANQDGNSLRDLIRETLKDKDLTITYDEAEFISALGKARPTLVPTGVKCKLDEDKVLQTYIRSSSALKHGLQLANSVGIIDSDYYGNEKNDGAIFFPIINLNPYPVTLEKGTVIGQGIISTFFVTEDDNATATRTGGFGSTNE